MQSRQKTAPRRRKPAMILMGAGTGSGFTTSSTKEGIWNLAVEKSLRMGRR